MKEKQTCIKCKKITSDIIINSTYYKKNNEKVCRYMCNPCNSERVKKYYQNNKEKVRGIVYAYNERNIEKKRAHAVLNYHIKVGNIEKSDSCEKCGVSDQKIEGHHEDYKKPREVTWLCTRCHCARHKELKLAA